ncbi:MAG: 4-phosphoerythronate dehydrogenase [Pseudomonadales bacterium]|jgi:erythronate-4-phosphate dehydrogenase|nr:4-phosphoerythronate dehydrogenase [Pseudomonadales bacterium]
MHILADENIAQAAAYFAPYGRLTLRAGRYIDASALHDVDVLLVRSVTGVDAALLADSPCRFVATATSGIDHVDTSYLAARGIGFAAALGCNAAGVVDYVLSALAALSVEQGRDWLHGAIGIVGCGEIGVRLAQRCIALGMTPKIYDPFLNATHPLGEYFAARDEVLRQALVTLHVPLTNTGAHPTQGMIDASVLAAMPSDGVLINAARGEVVDETALLAHCRQHPGFQAVLDAWQGEPHIDAKLLRAARYGTPHIAGYSHGGKLRGTQMIHAAFCAYFALDPRLASVLLPLEPALLHHAPASTALARLILQAYDLRRDDAALRQALQGSDPAANFDALRRQYPLRREFSEFCVQATDPALQSAVAALGMQFT